MDDDLNRNNLPESVADRIAHNITAGDKVDQNINILGSENNNSSISLATHKSGVGSLDRQTKLFLSGMDRYNQNLVEPNTDQIGLTFITRPRLNLSNQSLKADRHFAPLLSADGPPGSTGGDRPDSIPFLIKCMLDTKFARDNSHLASGLVNHLNPFNTALCSALLGISGWPDIVIQTETTDQGFYSEDQTYAVGHDDLSKTYDLTLTFKDIQYSPIAAMFFYWNRYKHNISKGVMSAYIDDIEDMRMNYTVSIYRFILDPRQNVITKYAKATGCFPSSLPIGAMFNYSKGDIYVQSSSEFSVPFKANKIDYNDYAIIQEFNILAERYWAGIVDPNQYIELPNNPEYNFMGMPYITTGAAVRGGASNMRLVFRESRARYPNLIVR